MSVAVSEFRRSKTPRSMTKVEFRRIDASIRKRGYRMKPRTAEEAFVFAIRFPDCASSRNHPSARFVANDNPNANADYVITRRAAALSSPRRVWRHEAYFLNFVPRAACSWRPTLPFSGQKFERPALP